MFGAFRVTPSLSGGLLWYTSIYPNVPRLLANRLFFSLGKYHGAFQYLKSVASANGYG